MQRIITIVILLSVAIIFTQCKDEGGVTDIEGNVYRTVVIGKYEWMVDNLKTTKYNDGTKIPLVTNDSAWASLNSGACCWYNNDNSNAEKYGALYNWYAVNTGKLCLEGWRVPTDEDWNYLESYVNEIIGKNEAPFDDYENYGSQTGKYLKANSGWIESGNGPDTFGFSALPGGERQASKGKFFHLGKNGFWWSASEENEFNAWFRCIIYSLNDVTRNTHPKRFGFAVRCVRDK